MRRPNHRIEFAGPAVTAHTAENPLPDPPNNSGDVSGWNGGKHGSPKQFELRITADGAETLSSVVLQGSPDSGSTFDVMGDINNAEDISLTASKGFRTRINHSPAISNYAITATIAGAAAITVTVRPLHEVE